MSGPAMFHPWEFLETFDLATWSHHGGGVVFERPRALQILHALAAEIHPRSALQLGACAADGAAVLTAALNAGFIEELHFVAPVPSDGFRAVLEHARLPRHVHVYAAAPVVIAAELWLVDGGDRHAVARAIENAPAMIAAIPPGAPDTWSAGAPGYVFHLNADICIGLNRAMIDEDTAALARDLVSTTQTWWGED